MSAQRSSMDAMAAEGVKLSFQDNHV
nr:rhamnogalacturonate lyase [Tanacetum cinerariifolium]